MQFTSAVGLAAVGMVVMQAAVALSGFGAPARIGALSFGLGIIVTGALRSAARLQSSFVSHICLMLFLCAVGFEMLSAFNSHSVFEPRLIVFRMICYILLLAGILIGAASASRSPADRVPGRESTVVAAIAAAAAPATWLSLKQFVAAEETRGSFDESSPVALGFSAGALAIAALTVSLRSRRVCDCLLGIIGFGGWLLICLQSGSRGALLSLGVSVVFLSVVSFKNAPKRVLLLVLIGATFLTGGFALSDNIVGQTSYVFQRFESILNHEADLSIAGSADSRAFLLEHNLKLDGLFLLGGEGYDPHANPHNFAAEAFVRLGVWIGAAAVLYTIFLLASGAQQLWRERLESGAAILLLMAVFTFLNAQTNMSWEMLRPLWLGLGFFMGFRLLHRQPLIA